MTDKTTKPDETGSMNLWQKLAAITGDVGSIAKDGQNREQKYSFIEYAAVAGQLRGLFAKYHVVCIPHMKDREATEFSSRSGAKGLAVTIHFEFVFKNADKPEEQETIEWIGEAADYGDKATNKAATGALKYCLMRTFNVSEKGDEDPDSTTVEHIAQRQEPAKRISMRDAIATAFKKMEAKGITSGTERKSALLKIAGVSEVNELNGELMDHVFEVLDSHSPDELLDLLMPASDDEAEVES
jgi:hypothetical protein